MIDLTLLRSHNVEKIDITDNYTIPKEYYDNTEVIDIKDVQVEGNICLKESEEDYEEEFEYVIAKIKGTLIIEDSISLEPVEYPFSIEYDDFLEENCKKSENSLDIFMFLWENIVLEVPLHYTEVEDLKKFSGDGWRLVSDYEPTNTNNPFKELLKNFDKE
ncbi:MAG: hypothetical protein IJ193_09150 [Bacilli bacterium]|nr:hypothetical protein [Bacilli bacterium]